VAAVALRLKPQLRGVFHELGFYVALALALPLVLSAEDGRARASAVAFSACLAPCFGASASTTVRPGRRAFASGSPESTTRASIC
jgi:hypothetical protein